MGVLIVRCLQDLVILATTEIGIVEAIIEEIGNVEIGHQWIGTETIETGEKDSLPGLAMH